MREAGVPDLWIEDAIQDVRLRLWQQRESGIWDTMIIRYAAIDAARRYGRHSRHGTLRDTVPIDDWPEVLLAHDDLSPRLNIEALKRELPKLSRRWQDALYHSVMKEHQSNNEEQAAAKAKRRLRQRCA